MPSQVVPRPKETDRIKNVAVVEIVLGLFVAIAAILSFVVDWPLKAKRAVLTWRGHRPIAIGSYQPPAPTKLPPRPPIPDAFPSECARMAKLHCYNHAQESRVIDFVNSKIRTSFFRGLKGAGVVPWHSVELAANVATGENIELTVWMTDGEPWPEHVREVRLILNGKTRAREKVRWRGQVRLRPYRWTAPYVGGIY